MWPTARARFHPNEYLSQFSSHGMWSRLGYVSPATPDRRLTVLWFVALAVPACVQVVLSAWMADAGVATSPLTLFWVVLISAPLCAVTSLAMMARAWCTGEAELGLTGAFFFSLSVLPLAHGITTPGVIYAENSGTVIAALVAIPMGLVATSPMFSRRLRRRLLPGDRWMAWMVASAAASMAFAVALVASPTALPLPTPKSLPVTLIALGSFAGCVTLSFRHLQLARIARRAGPLVVAAGYSLVGATSLVWLGAAPYSTGFWAAHILDIGGVFVATVAGLFVYRRTDGVRDVLSSVLVVDPLGALEVGLEPIVHAFVAELEAKDQITRDHVVRVAALSVRVGSELGLDAAALRDAGLTGILHDVGKLEIPDAVLKKPGRLTADEYEMVKTHTVKGELLLESSPVLAGIAAAVRSHHERIDGGGYPDGLSGDDIPRLARVVAVCDAYDAMANTRQYREGMGSDRAVAVLREHAGSQWDAQAVDALVRVVASNPDTDRSTPLDQVGRIGCDCLPPQLVDVVANALVGGDVVSGARFVQASGKATSAVAP